MDRSVIAMLGVVALLAGPATAGDPAPTDRVEAARAVYESTLQQWQAGVTTLDPVYTWSVRLAESEAAAGDARARAAHLERMQSLATQVDAQVAAGVARTSDGMAARYYVAEARASAAR